MPTTTKRRPAAKAQPVSDVRLTRVAWQSAIAGAVTYAVVIDARATTWPLATSALETVLSGIVKVLGGAA